MLSDDHIIKAIESTNVNLCSFACGIIANIPISIMVTLLDYLIVLSRVGISLFILRLLLLLSSVIICSRMIQFTILVISIIEESQKEPYAETRVNVMHNRVVTKLNIFKKYIHSFLLWAIIFFVSIIGTFVVNNWTNIQTPAYNEISSTYSTQTDEQDFHIP